MEIPTLKAEPRKVAGSRAAGRLRRSGKVPAIVYGHGENPVPVAVDYHDVDIHLRHGVQLVNLTLGGRTEPCLIKETQYDYLGSKLVHVDFARVDLNQRVKVKVPIELRGTPRGIAEGGVLRQELTELEVECLVTGIPEHIRVNVADLALNQVLHVRELKLEAGLRATSDPETVVATVRPPHVHAAPVEAAAPAEAATEPEVIAKGKIEKEGEEAEKPEKGEKK